MKPKPTNPLFANFFRANTLATAAVISFGATLLPRVSAESISINFGAGNAVTEAGKNTGAVPVAGNLWNNPAGNNGTNVIVNDSNGNPAATVTWTSANIWNSASTGATATSENGDLTKNYLDDGSGGPVITLNSPYLLNDIYLIPATDSASYDPFVINGVYYKGDGVGATVATTAGQTWVGQPWSNADTLTQGVNYLKVANQPAVNISGPNSGSGRASIAGIQVVNAYTGTLAYWDIDGATPGAGGATPTGNWGDANWSTDSSGSSLTGSWTSGHAAVFAAGTGATGTYTVTLAGTQTADAVWAQENAAITLTGGTLDLGSTGLIRADGTSSIAVGSVVSGTNISTVGAVTLSGTNSYSGSTTVASGTLTVNGGSAIPDASAVTLGGALTLGASETIGTLAGTGNITLAANTLTLGATASTSYSGVISGTGALVKQGSGSQALSKQSTYTGGTTVNGGVLDLTGGGGSGGTIRGTATVNTNGTLRLSTGDATGYGTGTDRLSVINLNGGTLNVNTTSNQTLGSGTLNLTGGLISGITGSNIDLFANGSSVNTFASATSSVISLPTMNLRQDNTVFTIADGAAADDLLISSKLGNGAQGNHAMIKAGPGTMKLTGASVYSGNTTLNAGTLDLTSGQLYTGGYFGAAVITVNTGATLKINNLGYNETAGSAASLGGLRDYASARVINGGTIEVTGGSHSTGNDFTVGTNGGVLRYNPADTTNTLTFSGNGNSNIPLNGALTLDAVGNVAITEIVEGSGSITKTGSGTLTLSGVNTYSGSTTINSGTLAVTGSGQLGGGSYSATIANASTLAFSSSANQTLSGVISGAGALTKSGSGVLTLSSTNTYTGSTTVNGGSLAVNGELDAASAVSVNAGGTLLGSGIIHGGVTIANGAVLTGGNGTSATLSMGSLTFASAATVNIGTLENYTSIAALESYGNLTLNGTPGAVTINLPTAAVGEGTYHLISSANTLANASPFVLGTAPALGNRQTGSLVINSGFLDYVVSGINPSWTGALSGEWSTSTLAEPKNWLTNVTTDYIEGDVVTFNDTATGTTAVTLASTVTPSSVFFDNSVLDYSVSGAGAIAGATTTLSKTGSGSLTLNTANTYGGGTVLNGGTIILGNTDALSSGPVTLGGGSLGGTGTVSGVVSGGALVIDSTGGTVTLTGVNTFTGATTITAGTLEIGGAGQIGSGTYAAAITNDGTLSINSSAAQTLSGAISGTGSLVKNGSGTLTLTASESFAGPVQINGGTLVMNSPAYTRTFSPTTTVTVNSGATLEIKSVNLLHGQSNVFTPITVNGGTITMNAYHNHFGPLTLNGGTVNGIYVGGYNGEYSTIDAGVTVGGSATSTFTRTGSSAYSINSAQTFTVAATGDPSGNDLVVAAPFIGSGSLIKTGAGKMVLSAVNTYSGATTINGGTLEISGAGQLGSGTYAPAIANAGTLAVNTTANQTLSGSISGTGSLSKGGTGGLTLTGTNTYTGNTSVNSGALTLSSSGALKFKLGNSNASNSVSGAGSAQFDGAFDIDTSAVTDPSGTWVLANVTTQSFTATFSVTGFSDPESDGTWTKTDGAKAWTFNEGNGTLTLVTTAGYDSWASGYNLTGGDALRTADPDGDGFSNLQEFLFGTNPTTSTGSLTTTTQAGGILTIRWNQRTSGASYSLKESATLSNDWTAWTGTPATDGPVSGDYQPMKADVTIGAGKDFFRVEGVEN